MHEDASVIVVDKPPGLLTANMPGESRESVFDALKELARERGGRQARVHIIHRLDKEASGLLVFAKTEAALHALKEDFRARRAHRLYLAVIEGEIAAAGDSADPAHTLSGEAGAEPGAGLIEPRPGVDSASPRPSGTLQSYMIENDAGGLARSVPIGDVAKAGRVMRGARPAKLRPSAPRRPGPPARDEPKLAVTHYRVLGSGSGRTLIQLRLGTGRKNQIRVHMKEWGRPIVGDQRYGAKTDPARRLCLHAAELGFRHPATGEAARFRSPPPPGFFGLVGMTPPQPREDTTRADQGAPSGSVGRTPPGPVTATPAARTSWDHVAAWYDELIDERRSDLYDAVIVPGVLRLLAPRPGMRVVDAACGQGDLCRRVAALGVEAVGVDASPRLIDAARSRGAPPGGPAIRYEVGDARSLDTAPGVAPGSFDGATCVMALMNMNPLEPVCRGVARLLKPGGSFVAVILHPAFRAPGQTSWGWDGARDGETKRRRDEETPARGSARQFRRVDGYLSPGQRAIVMNPGEAAGGGAPVTTVTFHRPIQAYIAGLSNAGLLVAAVEEWASPRVSRPGPRAAEENRARREIPMFLAFRAVKGVTGLSAP
ncbi:MAG: pseudouridine synthase [Phycisphaerales bacterium]